MSAQDKKAPGEGQIPIQQLMRIMPDIFTPQGLESLNQKLTTAKQHQKEIEAVIKDIADSINADSSARVKNHAVSLKKIAQKRLEGRPYDIDDINDALGGRITLNNPSNKQKAIDAITQAEQDGKFTINKQQDIKDDTHDSVHFDITLPSGQQAELQLLPSQQELAVSVAGHDIYQTYGENPPPEAEQINKMQNKIIDKLPDKKAKNLSDKLLQMHKANSDIPLPPIATAQVVANARKL